MTEPGYEAVATDEPTVREGAPLESGTPDGKRERSRIKFPYTDIRDATLVAETLKNSFGSQCTADQMAAALNQKVTSGAFRTKLSAAQIFGVVTNTRNKVTLTRLGQELADRHTRPHALVEAFLNVPLYRALYDKYQGAALPQGPGLDAEIKDLGVVQSQADRARQAFLRSAEHGGMFWSGRNRLVVPPTGAPDREDRGKEDASPETETNGKGKATESLADSPLLGGLWRMLPSNGDFGAEDRRRWFRALAVNLDLVYGEVDLAIELKPISSQRVNHGETTPG